MTVSRRNFIKIGSVSAALIAGNCLGLESKVFGQGKNIYSKSLPAEVYSDPLFFIPRRYFSAACWFWIFALYRRFCGDGCFKRSSGFRFYGSKKTARQIHGCFVRRFYAFVWYSIRHGKTGDLHRDSPWFGTVRFASCSRAESERRVFAECRHQSPVNFIRIFLDG